MKKGIIFKLTIFILIQSFLCLDISDAADSKFVGQRHHDLLSPAIEITSIKLQEIFFKEYSPLQMGKLKVEPFKAAKENDYYSCYIKITYRYDRPGLLSDIFEKIREKNVNALEIEMFKNHEFHVIRIKVAVDKEEQIREIVEELKKIDDRKDLDYEKIRMHTEKRVLSFIVPHQPGSLYQIVNFLKENNINIASFLPPVIDKNKVHFVLEVEVPNSLAGMEIKEEFQTKIPLDIKKIRESRFELIDKILDASLLKKIKLDINEKERKEIRRALRVVANSHLSQARKDRQTPFIMHPIEVVNILINEIKFLTPEMLSYLAQKLGTTAENIKIMVIQAGFLHDSVEDGDITKDKCKKCYRPAVFELVILLSKERMDEKRKGEVVYLNNLVGRKDILGLLAQLLKIADRLHNLRTLKGLNKRKQREVFFSTIDTFIPEFIDKIDLENVDEKFKDAFKKAIELIKTEIINTGKELKFIISRKDKVNEEQLELYLNEFIKPAETERNFGYYQQVINNMQKEVMPKAITFIHKITKDLLPLKKEDIKIKAFPRQSFLIERAI